MCKFIFRLVFIALLQVAPALAAEDAVNIYDKPREVPSHQIEYQSGQKFKLSDFNGDFVLAHFWSRDCAPCVAELKNLNTFYNKTQNDGIRLLMISNNSEWKNVSEQRRFLNKYKAQDLDFYTDNSGQVAADLGIFTSPHTVLINTQGQEIGRIRGSADWSRPAVIKYIRDLKEKHGRI